MPRPQVLHELLELQLHHLSLVVRLTGIELFSVSFFLSLVMRLTSPIFLVIVEVDQETWLLDADIRQPGLCVIIQPRADSGEHWHDGAYDNAEGVLIRVLQVGSNYTTTAQVRVKDPPRSDLPQEITIPVYFLLPALPITNSEAIVLHGDLKGRQVNVVAYEDDELAIAVAGGKIESAKKETLCKWTSIE